MRKQRESRARGTSGASAAVPTDAGVSGKPRGQPEPDGGAGASSRSRAQAHAEALAEARSKRGRCVLRIMGLMSRGLWVTGETGKGLAAEWECAENTVRDYASEASRLLELLGQREEVLKVVRAAAYERLEGAEDRDLVALLRLLADTVGGFDQRLRLDVTVAAKPDGEVVAEVVRELVARDDTRELVRAALAQWDRDNGRLLEAAGEEKEETE